MIVFIRDCAMEKIMYSPVTTHKQTQTQANTHTHTHLRMNTNSMHTRTCLSFLHLGGCGIANYVWIFLVPLACVKRKYTCVLVFKLFYSIHFLHEQLPVPNIQAIENFHRARRFYHLRVSFARQLASGAPLNVNGKRWRVEHLSHSWLHMHNLGRLTWSGAWSSCP